MYFAIALQLNGVSHEHFAPKPARPRPLGLSTHALGIRGPAGPHKARGHQPIARRPEIACHVQRRSAAY